MGLEEGELEIAGEPSSWSAQQSPRKLGCYSKHPTLPNARLLGRTVTVKLEFNATVL